jgi:hypothetical protein
MPKDKMSKKKKANTWRSGSRFKIAAPVSRLPLGAVWPHVKLTPTLTTGAFWTMLYVTYANVVITTFAAVVGASSLSPFTGQATTRWHGKRA